MNKNDLVGVVADKATITKAQAAEAVDAVFEAITGSLKAGEEVRLVGFGTFSVTKRKASTGRNPRTGETMTIAASTQPKFKAGEEVRLVGFGTFAVSARKASTGRNPATGAEIQIPASNQAKFKPGKGLKDAIN